MGVAFLLTYAVMAIRRAMAPEALTVSGQAEGGLRKALLTAAALTFLNPHVYLDTMLFVGSLANQHHDQKWTFAFGAAIASAVWFYGLAISLSLTKI